LFIKYFTERRTWLSANAGVVHYPNQVLATTRKFVGNQSPHFHSVIIRVDEIESIELTNLFKISLKVRNGFHNFGLLWLNGSMQLT